VLGEFDSAYRSVALCVDVSVICVKLTFATAEYMLRIEAVAAC
jgi:hypothetical protein